MEDITIKYINEGVLSDQSTNDAKIKELEKIPSEMNRNKIKWVKKHDLFSPFTWKPWLTLPDKLKVSPFLLAF